LSGVVPCDCRCLASFEATHQPHRLDHGHHRAHGRYLSHRSDLRRLCDDQPWSAEHARCFWRMDLGVVLGPAPRPAFRLLAAALPRRSPALRRWLPVAIIPGIGTLGAVVLGALTETLHGARTRVLGTSRRTRSRNLPECGSKGGESGAGSSSLKRVKAGV
jgi:hypothetical protein